MIALAANMIANQPKHMQDHLVEYMTPFLGAPNVLAMKNDEVHDLLRKQVEKARQNPWSCEIPPLATPAKPKDPMPAWQSKIAAETTAVKQVSV